MKPNTVLNLANALKTLLQDLLLYETKMKPNAVLNLANALKTLLQDLLLCDFINVSARFQKYSLSLRRYSTSKSS